MLEQCNKFFELLTDFLGFQNFTKIGSKGSSKCGIGIIAYLFECIDMLGILGCGYRII
jgi:hypothetical protein